MVKSKGGTSYMEVSKGKQNIRIVFFDIDGTLLKMGETEMTPLMKQTLHLLQKNHIKICLATGRGMMAIPDFHGIEFDAVLAFNGSYCIADNQVILKHPLPETDVHRIIENAAEAGRPVSIATAKEMVANGRDQDLEDYYAIAHEELVVSDKFEEYTQHDVYQMMLGCNMEERKHILDGTQHAKLAAWWDRAVDVIPLEGGKGAAIEQVLDYYHFTKEESVAFGDGANDIDMFQAVGTGIAMGNASEEVKAMADEVCGSVQEDGIYTWVLQHIIV